MSELKSTQDDSRSSLLDLIKMRGEISVDDALDHTGLARTTLREHFSILERVGWVEHRGVREGRGRPRLLYRLTERGQRLYPSRDGDLLREFFAFLRLQYREALVEELFWHYWQARYQKAKRGLPGCAPIRCRIT